MSGNDLVSFCKPLHITLTRWCDEDRQHRLSRRQNTIFALTTRDQDAYRRMLVGVAFDDLSHGIGNLITRVKNIQPDQFGRAIETVQMLFQVKGTTIVGAQRLEDAVPAQYSNIVD